MYSYVASDGKPYPADMNRLKEWAQAGYVEPYAAVVDTATGKQTRADAIPELQPIFAARFEAMARQSAAAAVKAPPSMKTKVLWGLGTSAFVFVVTAVNGSRVFDKPYHHPPFPSPPPQRSPGDNSFVKPAGAQYLAGPMPEKERQRIYWEFGMCMANAEIAANKRFPDVRLPSHPSPSVLAREDARRKRLVTFMIDLTEKNRKQLAKKVKLSQSELELINDEGHDKKWPFPYKVIKTTVSSP